MRVSLRPHQRLAYEIGIRSFRVIVWFVRNFKTLARRSRAIGQKLARLIVLELTRIVPDRRLMKLSESIIRLGIPPFSHLTQILIQASFIRRLASELAAGRFDGALRLARIANLALRPQIQERRDPIVFLYFKALFRARRYHRIAFETGPEPIHIDDPELNFFVGAAHLYEGDLSLALFYLDRATELDRSHPYYRTKGRAHLLAGNEDAARSCFETSAKMAPHTIMAHMNYAGRYDVNSYVPKPWELRDAGDLLIFDNYGQLAEDFFHLGYLSKGLQLYQRMLNKQQRYSYRLLPDKTVRRLTEYSGFDPAKPIRILGYEWVTQYGHIGLLDSYTKMTLLGMYPEANYVLLAPNDKISNRHFLDYWGRYFTIVHDSDLVAELFPWQRMLGDGFNAYPGNGDRAEHWTRIAAKAQIQWATERRAPLLTASLEDRKAGARLLAQFGVPEGAWYVGLHVREGSFHKEERGDMSTHRNSDIDHYIPAIREITKRGGYVIRLGDPGMRPLPSMNNVVDYAHSHFKSPAADIFFCATSRFIIGTTSGLTTASLSFGTPMILVNCISSDWQLWTAETDFIVKRVWSTREKRFLSFQETYADPTQGYLMNAHMMRRRGLEAIPNTAGDILKAVVHKLDKLEGRQESKQDHELLLAYQRAIADNPAIFGAARPVPAFLADYPELLTATPRKPAPGVLSKA